ncbi:hypothetical protein TWF694_009419 [Orbilia ellipsospora]|uniref:A-kinase anchor protein 7-like phosphoesterase domain-containing protein n=1 Tax=Orbilia ellipsospora TaxID=2528407 RepID=A0AAV9XBT8_9PEZI
MSMFRTSSYIADINRIFQTLRISPTRGPLPVHHFRPFVTSIRKMASDSSDGETHHDGASTEQPSSSSSKPHRSRPTHFLCLPLHGQHYPTLPQSYLPFKSAIKQFTIDETSQDASEESSMPADAIRYFNTLHLTLGVMSLTTPEKLQQAISTLESLDVSQFLSSDGLQNDDEKKLNISLKGLESMDNSRKGVEKCAILIIPPTDAPSDGGSTGGNRLYTFASALRQHFINEGIMTPENRPLKLHATVVNTVYSKKKKGSKDKKSKNSRGGGRRGNKERITFDATDVVERYKDHVWAEKLEIDRVQICNMGADKGEEVVGEDGTVEVVGNGYRVAGSRLIWP